jgi:hypothetical protein
MMLQGRRAECSQGGMGKKPTQNMNPSSTAEFSPLARLTDSSLIKD